jgi:hypothetical protein
VKQRPTTSADAPLYTTGGKPGNWQLSPELALTDAPGETTKNRDPTCDLTDIKFAALRGRLAMPVEGFQIIRPRLD